MLSLETNSNFNFFTQISSGVAKKVVVTYGYLNSTPNTLSLDELEEVWEESDE
jgi:hypothetical protein